MNKILPLPKYQAMRKFYILLLFIGCAFGQAASAQDQILLMNSRDILDIKVLDVNTQSIQYKKTNKTKSKSIYREDVFSIRYSDGTEKVIFVPDTNQDGDFSVEGLRMFLNGSRESQEKYHPWAAYIFGVASGLGGVLFYREVVSINPAMILLPPAAGLAIISIGSPNMKKQPVDPKYLNNEEYLMGYQHKARKKKIRNSFYGALLGIAVGIPLFFTGK